MALDTKTSINERVVSHTERYTDQIDECVTLVPELLTRYGTGVEYQEIADRIRERESSCDRRNRQLSAIVTNASVKEMGLRGTRVHLHAPQLVELYQRLDEIPNTAEQIAEELVTITPDRTAACFRQLRKMAECAVTAIEPLLEAVNAFVRLLCSPARSGTISAEIETVRRTESTCDRLRNEVIETAFHSESVAQPMVYREFALLFDALVDAMEDVTDQLVLLSSSESWITTEPNRE